MIYGVFSKYSRQSEVLTFEMTQDPCSLLNIDYGINDLYTSKTNDNVICYPHMVSFNHFLYIFENYLIYCSF